MSNYKGLTWLESVQALRQFGLNTPQSEQNLSNILKLIYSPLLVLNLISILFFALIDSFFISLLLVVVLLINIYVRLIYTYLKSSSIKNLNNILTNKVTVIRDSLTIKINKENVVPKDILVLNKGDIVPADSYLLEANNLKVRLDGKELKKNLNLNKQRNTLNGNLYTGEYIINGNCIVEVFETKKAKPTDISFEKDFTLNININIALVLLFTFVLLAILAQMQILPALIALGLALVLLLIFNQEFLNLIILSLMYSIQINLSDKIAFKKISDLIKFTNSKLFLLNDSLIILPKLNVSFFETTLSKDEFFRLSYLATVDGITEKEKVILNFVLKESSYDSSEFLIQELRDDNFSERVFKEFSIMLCDYNRAIELTNLTNAEEVKLNLEKGLTGVFVILKTNSTFKHIGTFYLHNSIKNDVIKGVEILKERGVTVKYLSSQNYHVATSIALESGLIFNINEAESSSANSDNNKISLYYDFNNENKDDVLKKFNSEQKVFSTIPTNSLSSYKNFLYASNFLSTDIEKAESNCIILNNNLEAINYTLESLQKSIRNILFGSYATTFTILLANIIGILLVVVYL